MDNMKFEGWQIEANLDYASTRDGADISTIRLALVRSLEKLVFECGFLPREGDLIAPDISSEDRYALNMDTYNSMDIMLVIDVVFYPNEKKIKFNLE